MTNEPYHLIVTNIDSGLRLDKFIADKISDISRSRCKSIIESDNVKRNDIIFNDSSYRIKSGEEYIVNIPLAEPSYMIPNEEVKLDIQYEDEHFLIINKQAGLTVHPGAGNQHETMANALMAHCKDNLSGIGGVARPGIVHRLDKDTSGLILAAKTDLAHNNLSDQIAKRTAKRTYTAFCWGVPTPYSSIIKNNIDRHPKNRLKMTIVDYGGKHAVTNYEVKKIYGDNIASKIECKLDTGRTHQIRVHLSNKGHPLIGDPLYGNKNNNKNISVKRRIKNLF